MEFEYKTLEGDEYLIEFKIKVGEQFHIEVTSVEAFLIRDGKVSKECSETTDEIDKAADAHIEENYMGILEDHESSLVDQAMDSMQDR